MRNVMLLLCSFLLVNTHAQNVALNFAGDDDWVTGTNNSLPQGNTPRTIETWIRYSTSKNDMSIFNYGTFSFNQKFTLHLYNGVYIIGEGNDLSTGYHFNDGNWHHLAVTHNGTTTIVYVDGIVRGSRNTTYNTTGFSYQIGVSLRNGNWDFRFEGTVDELRVWNVARTQQEIVDHMHTSINSAPGLIASYRLNDGVANADNRAITTVVDASGNGNHGTLNNFAMMGGSSNYIADAAVLPVNLLSFTVREANCMAVVKWQTTDESNMQHFIIEESKDEIDFSSAKQLTAENTSGENSYAIYLPVNSAKSFYRLKMVGVDNKATYSKTVLLKAGLCDAKIAIWSNPVKNVAYLRSDAIGSEYLIYNSIGALVKKGLISNALQHIDVNKFAPGLYYVSVNGSKPVVFTKE